MEQECGKSLGGDDDEVSPEALKTSERKK